MVHQHISLAGPVDGMGIFRQLLQSSNVLKNGRVPEHITVYQNLLGLALRGFEQGLQHLPEHVVRELGRIPQYLETHMSYSLNIAVHQGRQHGIETTFRFVEFKATVEVHGQNYHSSVKIESDIMHSTTDFDFDHETFLGLEDTGRITEVVEEEMD